ncbi:hypothetical protein FACS189472_17250 [Alphaproteobacteria bacterium]|nr:hypothetical protein FACS189472_17250 [Alphaproteobacteria bacterium]
MELKKLKAELKKQRKDDGESDDENESESESNDDDESGSEAGSRSEAGTGSGDDNGEVGGGEGVGVGVGEVPANDEDDGVEYIGEPTDKEEVKAWIYLTLMGEKKWNSEKFGGRLRIWRMKMEIQKFLT